MNHPFVVAACASLSNQMVDQLLLVLMIVKIKMILKVYLNKQIMVLFILMRFVTFLDTQAKLINVIQDQSFYKYGSNKKIKIDIRVIAGTSMIQMKL